MMTKAHRQEALSLAYVQSVAACCGLGVGRRLHDYGVDLSLHEITLRNRRYSETGRGLDLQVKSTTTPLVQGGRVLYDLDVETYEHLRERAVGPPRILVLLVLPAEETDWLSVSADHLLLRRCAYWVSLRGFPATTNASKVRVALPQGNIFSPAQADALVGSYSEQTRP